MECRQCRVLEEQLDIERERVSSLIEVISGKSLEEFQEEDKDVEPRNIRQVRNWGAQQQRLKSRATRDFQEWRKKEEEREAGEA